MRLKKKEEAKVEAKPEAKADDTAMEVEGKSEGTNVTETTTTTEENTEGTGAVSVLGIGGRKIQGNAAKKPSKKRTPGEIRIQKGKDSSLHSDQNQSDLPSSSFV